MGLYSARGLGKSRLGECFGEAGHSPNRWVIRSWSFEGRLFPCTISFFLSPAIIFLGSGYVIISEKGNAEV